ncbi:hypothetical protein FisN_25Lh027 [Fistulifera solaris]|uniref:Uncharacterized protein n=1 Tax=Fistulifera solaris TaxID=1519565 RepID=A0A1Z5JLW4_FISSO|nr:hypothetical protein FisN_25Lh027 [Fistulifera solaris]|eukprot:GAX14778.1 hypothetical protein FisN_25Lh027 [Fistulifera solaris]
MYKRGYSYYAHLRLYGWFLSLASVMILTGLQLRTQLLLTRQITEETPVTTTVASFVSASRNKHQSQSLYAKENRRHRLILGTSETLLRSANHFSSSSHNVNMHSLSFAASCLQSLLTTNNGGDKEWDYDTIEILLPDTTIAADDESSLSLLLQRLRQRYPAAEISVHQGSIHNSSESKREGHKVFETLRTTKTTTTTTSSYEDSQAAVDSGKSWGIGDACYWFHPTTNPPLWMEFNPRAVQSLISSLQFSSYLPSFLRKRRLDISNELLADDEYYYYDDTRHTLTVHNPFDTERMLYLTYKVGPQEALTRIRLDGIPALVIEPYRESDDSDVISWEMSPVGKVAPRQSIRVQWNVLSSPLDGDDKSVFRILGVSFGAQSSPRI